MLLIRSNVFEKAEKALMSEKASSNAGSDHAASHPLSPPSPQEEERDDQQMVFFLFCFLY